MRLHKMIAELYDATKAKSGNFTAGHPTSINFDELITRSNRYRASNYNRPIIFTSLVTPMWKSGDKHRLIQVITNYLSNGIKYSQGKEEVTLSVEAKEESVIVSVKDEGLGIPVASITSHI